jgi:peptidoglycan hydrolase-like protein with peptidoglycan-binding domain
VRSAVRTSRGAARAADQDRRRERWFVLQALGWSHRDVVAFGVALFAVVAVLINVLFMQKGQHPAPMFKSGLMAGALGAAPAKEMPVAAIPRARPPEAAAVPAKAEANKAEPSAPARPSTEIIADIQRELARRGLYDGVVDGRHGPRTDAAIRDFEHANGLKPSPEVNEALLQAIRRQNPKSAKPTATGATTGRGAVRHDPIAEVLAPSSKRVLAVQRALAEYGYGQIKPSGVIDAETRSAIEKFERERKLPVTGLPSDRVARELAAITGRPLE